MNVRNWLLLTLLVATPSARADDPLATAIKAVTGRPEYKHGRWGVYAVDLKTGESVFEQNVDQRFIPASTTKLYSCSAALCEFGSDFRFVTRVVTDPKLRTGEAIGDLVLIASGDLSMGGRTKADGTMAFTNNDHTYADEKSTTATLTDTDPLAGLNEIAKQIRANGIRRVSGEVLIDDRMFQLSWATGSGPDKIVPILINDNVVDFVITPGEGDQPPKVTMRPETAYVQFESQVITGGVVPRITVTAESPRRIVLRGNIPAKSRPMVRIWPVDDPAAFARCLLIESLRRQGVTVAANVMGGPAARLPDAETLAKCEAVAELKSPPLSEAVKVILKVSHNLYASTLPLLLATRHEQRTLEAGMRIEGRLLKKLGVDGNGVSFAGGAGGARSDSTTPRSTVTLLRKMSERPEFAALEAGMPLLGVDGTLAEVVPADSPARGKVYAKTGTLSWTDHFNGGTLLTSKALAGTMTTAKGRKLAFSAFVNDVYLPPGVTTQREGKALGALAEAIYTNAP